LGSCDVSIMSCPSPWLSQAKVVNIATGAGGVPFSRIDNLDLDYAAGDSYLRTCVHDSKRGYLLFGTSSSPAKMIKCSTVPMAHIETFTLPVGEDRVRCSLCDPECNFAYYGLETKPARIVKVAMETFKREKAITLPDTYDDLRCCGYDHYFPKRNVGYFCTFAHPCHIVKVDLDKLKVEKSLVLSAQNGEGKCNGVAIDGITGIAVLTLFTDPGRIVRVLLKPKTVIEPVLDDVEIRAMAEVGEHEAEMERQMRERFRQLRATQMVQRWVRERQRIKRAREERARLMRLRDNSARLLQRALRGLLGRLRHRRMRMAYFNENRARAIALSQRGVRAALEARKVREHNRDLMWLNERLEAILKLQRIWRGRQGRNVYLNRLANFQQYQMETNSATLLQCVMRGRIARKIYRTMQEKRGATMMQKVIRGKLARNEYERRKYAWLLSEQERASLVISSAVRGWKARRRARRVKQYRIETMAAIKMQARFRMLRARRELERRKVSYQAQLMMMAHRIQMRWRAYVSRKRAWGRRRGRLEGRAAEILQAVLRQYATRKKYQQTVIARHPQLFQQCSAWLKMYDRLRTAILLPEGPGDPRVQNMAKNATISANVIAMECLSQNRYTWAFALIKRIQYVLRTPNLDFASKSQLTVLTKRNIQQVRYRLYDTYP